MLLTCIALPCFAQKIVYRHSTTGAMMMWQTGEDDLIYRISTPDQTEVRTLNQVFKNGIFFFEFTKNKSGTIISSSAKNEKGMVINYNSKIYNFDVKPNEFVLLEDMLFFQLRDFPILNKQVIPVIHQETQFDRMEFEPLTNRKIDTPLGIFECRGIRMRLGGFFSLFAYIRWEFWYSLDNKNYPIMAEEYKDDSTIKSQYYIQEIVK